MGVSLENIERYPDKSKFEMSSINECEENWHEIPRLVNEPRRNTKKKRRGEVWRRKKQKGEYDQLLRMKGKQIFGGSIPPFFVLSC